MRFRGALMVAFVAAGCGDPPPTSVNASGAALLASVQSELVPPVVYNTQMRSELEVPACESASKGHAQIKVLRDGTIESVVIINNKGGENVRFGHIHHVTGGVATGPIIWWLSTPVGGFLNITDRHIDIRQAGVFVANTHFADAETALADLLSDPSSFYVNFHSDACPGGFARGFLP